eukprot:XP_011454479.2 PREDICTED: atrial natriuretic peptide receptor 1-like [Crassostrea gigas]
MFFLKLFPLLVLCNINSIRTKEPEITLSVILTKGTRSPWGLVKTEKAIEMGNRRLRELLAGLATIKSHTVTSEYIGCSRKDIGALGAELYHVRNTSVFIGPGCSSGVDVVGRMSTSWNIPLLTPVGIDSLFDNKTVFPTLTRLSFSFDGIGRFYLKLFEKFGWTDIALLTDYYVSNGAAMVSLQSDSLVRVFSKSELRTTLIVNHDLSLKAALTKATKVSRVIVSVVGIRRLRVLLLEAREMGMTNGDYVFLFFKSYSPLLTDIWYVEGDKNNDAAKEAFNALLVSMPSVRRSPAFLAFDQELKNYSLAKFDFDFDTEGADVNHYIVAYHDAFLIYGKTIKEMIIEGMDIFDGRQVTRRIRNKTYHNLISGNLRINDNGDAEKDLSIYDLDPNGDISSVGVYAGDEAVVYMNYSQGIHWPGNKGPPKNRPRCGFTGDDPICFPEESDFLAAVVTATFSVVFVTVFIAGTFTYRHLKLQMDLQNNWWRIPWESLKSVSERESSCIMNSKLSMIHMNSSEHDEPKDKMNKYFKGSIVSVSVTKVRHFHPSRSQLMDLLNLRNVHCVNLTKFYGLTQNNTKLYIVSEACSRGTLKDILHNSSFKINKDLQTSLICDMIKGCSYLHASPVRYHGSLTSQNCLIDKRFVLKITGFGLPEIRTSDHKTDKQQLFYVAPEVLRNAIREPNFLVFQSADVYSFGVILYEILTRKEPFEDDLQYSSIDEIIEKIKSIPSFTSPFKADVEEYVENSLLNLMYSCLEGEAEHRPTFAKISKESKRNKWGISGENFLDILLFRMEEYANNLEHIAEERMHAFLDEKRRSDELLYQVLPRSIARDLIRGHKVEAEAYQCVTIYFSDIVGFTAISAMSNPMQIVDMLNDLYTCFDTVLENYDVYKVETIGDAYMVVSGLPLRNGNEHVTEIAKMSVAILDSVNDFHIRHLPDVKLRARIGIHSGPVCAGVVGKKMPRYCLFGDTVNTASRMESNGEAMKIHVSSTTRNLLQSSDLFVLQERGSIAIKGKGDMTTYWLMAREATL